MNPNPFRKLPSVTQVLDVPAVRALTGTHPREAVVAAVRAELAEQRLRLHNGQDVDGTASPELLAVAVAGRLARAARPPLRTVINATGIVLHTNLGRSPLAESAARAAYDAARGYLNLELDLATGKRSSRQRNLRAELARLTGAESGTAVNNCAAATLLVLRALAHGKEVIVSRGELIEIGGSFRIPDIMAVGGATLCEVGTTNITRAGDYERAISPRTALLMRVHPSNYRVRGFTKAVPLAELVALGRKHHLPVIDDIGSGAMWDLRRLGIAGEPVACDSIAAGADLVLFSGDKLLGGPQAGLIAGRAALVQQLERDPLMRAFRLDKMTLAALQETLRLHANFDRAVRDVPTLRLLATPAEELRRRAERLADGLRAMPGVAAAEVRDDVTFVGGGSVPDQPLPAAVLVLTAERVSAGGLAARLRGGEPAVLGRVRGGVLRLDVRTVFEEQEAGLVAAVRTALAGG